MTNVWYQDPKVLFENMDRFFPRNDLNKNEKINSLVRFAIYYALLIILFKQDTKWLSVSVILILISLFMGVSEDFSAKESVITGEDTRCQEPTENNPFMNFTLNDLMENPDRPKACYYDDVKDKMREKFRKKIYSDPADTWGNFISDRNFYTMPNTELINDQTGFAEWCYGDMGVCKSTGNSCLKDRDNKYHRGRIVPVE